jgi:hypothetical protein
MRLLLALISGAAVAALGGLIMGEYPFRGFTPYIAGVLFGLVVSELIVSVAGRQNVVIGVASALCAGGGLAYAVWDDAGFGVRPIALAAWVGVAIGTIVAGARGGWWWAWREARAAREAREGRTVTPRTR